jgi:Zn-dependent protease with chaperone function
VREPIVGHSRARLAVAFALLAASLASGCHWGRDADERGRVRPHFEPGFNLFTPEQDVEIGRQSAEEVARQMPLLEDPAIVEYVRGVGQRLVAQAPGERFPYEFYVVDVKELNAFALPGGFVFVNRGTLEAVDDEGELAGVVAHEISHVALRHGTNQVTKAYIAQAGLGILQKILGAGGSDDAAAILGAVGGLGLNSLFLKFGRTAERQADLTGAEIMAKAGYDPRDMAEFFQKLERESPQRVPDFLSDHPNPGDRVRSIEEVRDALDVSPQPIKVTEGFRGMQARLRALRPARSMQAAMVGPEEGGRDVPSRGVPAPEPPSDSLDGYEAPTGVYAVEHPSNWDVLSDGGDTAAFAPRGGYGKLGDDLVFTHGVMVGIFDAKTSDLAEATGRFVEAQLRANADFRVAGATREVTVGGRPGLAVPIAGPSAVTGELEVDVVYATLASDGRLFYAITVAPRGELERYGAAFERVLASIRLG